MYFTDDRRWSGGPATSSLRQPKHAAMISSPAWPFRRKRVSWQIHELEAPSQPDAGPASKWLPSGFVAASVCVGIRPWRVIAASATHFPPSDHTPAVTQIRPTFRTEPAARPRRPSALSRATSCKVAGDRLTDETSIPTATAALRAAALRYQGSSERLRYAVRRWANFKRRLTWLTHRQGCARRTPWHRWIQAPAPCHSRPCRRCPGGAQAGPASMKSCRNRAAVMEPPALPGVLRSGTGS